MKKNKAVHSRPISIFLLILLMLTRQASTSCSEATDYLGLVGSLYTNLISLYVAPNSSAQDILVAGSYTQQSDGNIKAFIYLFQESSCSHLWAHNFYETINYIEVRGLAWSHDESKAFLLSKNSYSTSNELITVIRSPYSWRGAAEDAATYKLPKSSGQQALYNDASMFAVVSPDNAPNEERLLVLRQYEMSFVRIYEQGNLRHSFKTEVADSRRTVHACYNSEANAAYLLGVIDADYQFWLTKYSIDNMLKVGDGRTFVYQSKWSDNEDYNNDLGGRVAVHRDSARKVETVYVATSQIYASKSNLGAGYADILKMTYTNDAQDCRPDNNCVRQNVKPYAKALAIAPVNANFCYFLFIKTDNKDIARVAIVSVDFSVTAHTIINQANAYLEYTINTSTYDEQTLMSSAFYQGGVFKDFYLQIVLQRTPEVPEVMPNGDVGAMLTLTRDRVTDFFGAAKNKNFASVDGETFTLTAVDVEDNTFWVGSYQLTLTTSDDYLIHFNGHPGTVVTHHKYDLSLVQDERQVKLDCAPFQLNSTNINLTYGVGGNLWTTFPVYYDYEYDSGLGLTPTPITLVSYEYGSGETSLPAINSFFRVYAELDSISSGTFTADHVGSHTLKVRVADQEGAQTYFQLIFKVKRNVQGGPTMVPYSIYEYEEEEEEEEAESSSSESEDTSTEDTSEASTESTEAAETASTSASTEASEESASSDDSSESDEASTDSSSGSSGTGKNQGQKAGKGGQGSGGKAGGNAAGAGGQGGKNGGGAGGASNKGGQHQGGGQAGAGHGGKNGAGQGKAGQGGAGQAKGQGGQGKGQCKPEDKNCSAKPKAGSGAAGQAKKPAKNSDKQNKNGGSNGAGGGQGKQQKANFKFDPSKYKRTSGCTLAQGCDSADPIETVQIKDVHIDNSGRILIYFNQPIRFLKEIFQLVKQMNAESQQEAEPEFQESEDGTSTRRLQLNVDDLDNSDGSADQLIDFFSLFEIHFVAGEDSSIDNERIISWEIVDIADQMIEMQMTWDDPSVISKDGLEDEIVLSIDTTLLGEDFAFQTSVTKTLPKQLSEEKAAELEQLEESATSAQAAVQAVAGAISLSQFLLAGVLSQLWGLINGLQIFVHIPLVGVEIPENALMVLNKLIEIVQFDVVENEDLYGSFLEFPEENETLLIPKFDETGYGSSFPFVNMGINVPILNVISVLLILLFISWFVNAHRQNAMARLHHKITGSIFWNFFLRLCIQGCLEFTIADGLYLFARDKLLDERTPGADYAGFFFINDVLAFSTLIVFCVAPAFVLIFYCYNFKKLSQPSFKKSYGSAYVGLIETRRSAIFFPFFFVVRRSSITCMAFWLEQPALFIFILILLTMIETIYLMLYKPFDSELLQGLELFNEFTSFVLLYATLCFTWYVVDETARLNIGWVFVGGMGINMMVHLFFMVKGSCKDCQKKCIKRKLKQNSVPTEKRIKEGVHQDKDAEVIEMEKQIRKHHRHLDEILEVGAEGEVSKDDLGDEKCDFGSKKFEAAKDQDTNRRFMQSAEADESYRGSPQTIEKKGADVQTGLFQSSSRNIQLNGLNSRDMRTSVDLDYLHERVILRQHESSMSSLEEDGGDMANFRSSNDVGANDNQQSCKDLQTVAPDTAAGQFQGDGEFDAIVQNAKELILDGKSSSSSSSFSFLDEANVEKEAAPASTVNNINLPEIKGLRPNAGPAHRIVSRLDQISGIDIDFDNHLHQQQKSLKSFRDDLSESSSSQVQTKKKQQVVASSSPNLQPLQQAMRGSGKLEGYDDKAQDSFDTFDEEVNQLHQMACMREPEAAAADGKDSAAKPKEKIAFESMLEDYEKINGSALDDRMAARHTKTGQIQDTAAPRGCNTAHNNYRVEEEKKQQVFPMDR